MKKPPIPPEEIARRIRAGEAEIKLAPVDVVEALQPYVDRVVYALKELCGISSLWVSDESCVSDVMCDGSDEEYAALGRALGIALDRTNEDDQYIVRIARRLKQQDQLPS
jgi:hypothetical protein